MQPSIPDPSHQALLTTRLDLLPPGPVADNLRALVARANDAHDQLRPDFYGYLSIADSWFDQQNTTLAALDSALATWLTSNPDDGVNGPPVRLLVGEVAAQRAYLANLRLAQRLPGGICPPLIHVIWSGNPIRSEALSNILSWGDRVKDTDWKITVWTDQVNQDWSILTKGRLYTAGVKLSSITKDTIDPRLWPAYDVLVHTASQVKPNYPAASDIARYSILKRLGGVYLDVDIAPGTINLPSLNTYLRLPLLAPEIRDTRAVREELGLPEKSAITAAMVQQVAQLRLRKGLYNNNFIVTPADSPVIEAVIVQVLAELAKIDRYGGVASLLEMPDNAAFTTGPVAVKRALLAYVGSHFTTLNTDQHDSILNRLLNHQLTPGWVTTESDNQEH